MSSHEHEPRHGRGEGDPGDGAEPVRPQPGERGHGQRKQREPGRVLEGGGQPGGGARERVVPQPAALVRAHRGVERDGHAGQRAHVGDGHARVRHGQEGEAEHGRGHEALAGAPEPACRPVRGRHACHAERGRQRARGDPDLRRVLGELLGDVREAEVEERAEGPVHHPQEAVEKVGVRGGVLVVARIEVLPEHLDRVAGEVGGLVDAPHVGQAVVVVPDPQGESGHQDQAEEQAGHAGQRSGRRRGARARRWYC